MKRRYSSVKELSILIHTQTSQWTQYTFHIDVRVSICRISYYFFKVAVAHRERDEDNYNNNSKYWNERKKKKKRKKEKRNDLPSTLNLLNSFPSFSTSWNMINLKDKPIISSL